jgi:hypothetical protein
MLQSRFVYHVRVERVERSTPLRPLRKTRVEHPAHSPPFGGGESGAEWSAHLVSYGPVAGRAGSDWGVK